MAELSTAQPRCETCGRESIYLALDEGSSICEDCRPETGAGSRLVERLAVNLRRLRLGAGMKRDELERRAGMVGGGGRAASYEGDDAEEPNLATALRLAHSLGVSIDQLTEGIYWTPGQIVRGQEKAAAERLVGFFEVLPANVPVFEPRAQRETASGPEDVARIFGANLRAARERRHLTQRALASAAGLSRSGVILIEAGTHETTIEALFAFSRALESPPDLLLDGIDWRPAVPRSSASSGEADRPARSLDDGIRRLWAEGMKTREIAARLGTSAGNVSATVHRLRERGEEVGYRRAPTRAIHARARARREACMGITCDLASSESMAAAEDAKPRAPASNKEIVLRLGANISLYRKRSGLTFRALGEATEINYSPLCRLERARSGIPQPAFVLKLAGSLNVRCGLITEGVKWDVASQSFRIEETVKPPPPLAQLGLNAMRARYRSHRSQQSVADRASLRREDVADLERGSRNFRLSTVIRLAGALEISMDELFAEVSTWHVRPLAPPEFAPGQRPSKAERDRLLIRLWNEGRPETEIADALGLSRNAVAPYVRELRNAGEDLPYRRPPRSAIEAAARRRRAHAGPTRTRVARRPGSP
ncbi:MAG: helix-turn-helix domain-containing protein [Solirubrobacterales bacterium]